MSYDCQAICWVDEYANDAVCSLPPGHPGPHWDQVMGWEW